MKSFWLVALFYSVAMACAAAPTEGTIRITAEHYLAKEPLPVLDKGFSMEEALTAQEKFVRMLEPKLGRIAGYKIGLITKQGQERMGASGPVHGVLLKKMLRRSGGIVSAQYGVKPGAELDMGVYVKDAGITNATTTAEAIAHLSDLVCFIELVDTITATNQVMDAPLLVSLNVGARAGIIGARRRMTHELAEALPAMRMYMADENGTITADVPKLNLQPLDNLPALIADLNKHGMPLKRGDFISVGSPAPIQPITPGKKMVLHYEGLPGGPMTASVTFSN